MSAPRRPQVCQLNSCYELSPLNRVALLLKYITIHLIKIVRNVEAKE